MFYYRSSNRPTVPLPILSMCLVLLRLIGDKDRFGVVRDQAAGATVDGADAVYGSNFSLSIFHNDYK